MTFRARTAVGLVSITILAACASRPSTQAPVVPKGNLHALGVGAKADPTVMGAHLVPEQVDEDRTYGVEPGGGIRTVVSGIRVVTLSTGAVLSSPDRLPQAPQTTLPLPERLGGGFLFQIGTTLWRAERWLAPVKPLFTSPSTIQRLVVGLDRLYVRTPNGAWAAFDARTGSRLDMGAWPSSPFVGAYGASDGWRAAAIADLRGVVATFDAGATWRSLALPIIAKDVVPDGDALAVRGVDLQGQEQWYEVRGDGQVGRLPGPPARAAANEKPAAIAQDGASRAFGKRPLAAAIEDGWPLSDGTAIVARDGALARVRLTDGALVDAASDAYPMKPSRCHPVSLARGAANTSDGAFGFVCGESKGATIVYRYVPQTGRMMELRRFDKPRAILSSGNGALAVRGSCAAGATSDEVEHARAQQSYCVFGRDDQWRELRVRGDIGGERLVVLADGRIVVVSPPHGDLATTRLTLLDKGKAATVAVAFPPISVDVARALKHGVWMDGFEERRPGVVGGWIDGGGTVLGIEIGLDGHAKVGRYVRDGSAPMVSGRYGLGWTASRRGYETIDGGMTWTELELPEPIVNPRAVTSRACGPIGCSAGGWLRVGWGPTEATTKPDVPPIPRGAVARSTQTIELECDATAGPPPEPAKPVDKKKAVAGAGVGAVRAVPVPPPHYGGYGGYGGYGYGSNWTGMAELPPFYATGAPALRADDLGLMVDAYDTADRTPRTGLLARLYTWGPKSAEWEHSGKWLARWTWPYGGWPDVRSSQITVAPFQNLDAARRGFGIGPVAPIQWSMASGDDASHALLLGRRAAGGTMETLAFVLDADRPPVEVKRLDGELLGEVEAATRVGGHWYLVTSTQAPQELPTTIVWLVDGSFAREIARVPRAGYEGKPATRLARRSDGRAIGIVVDGQPSADRPVPQRWVLPIDLETAAMGEPENLGSNDFGDRPLTICNEASAGWVLDASLGGSANLKIGKSTLRLNQPLARVELTRDSACIEHLAGSLEYYGGVAPETLSRAKGDPALAPRADTMTVGIYSQQRMRHPLRCSLKR